MATVLFCFVALCVFLLLLVAPFASSPLWRATVTPLASIIGSGFLVSAPLLAREFGGFAAPAMLLLIILAALLGWVIRYNIRVVEPLLAQKGHPAIQSVEKLSHLALTFAYFVSVTYYLALLGNFVLQSTGVENPGLANQIAMVLLVCVGALGWSGGAERVAGIERYTTALNLAVILGFLAALLVYGVQLGVNGNNILPPPGKFSFSSLPVLLGLLIVVQGFETVRFTGDQFDGETRQKAMRLAQLVSGIVYVTFFLLLSPLMEDLAKGTGVAAIITVSAVVAAMLPLSLTVAAAASQFSASIADSLGNAGLIRELSANRIDSRHAYPLIAFVGIAILTALDIDSVIALASRAFALYYALECVVAWLATRDRTADRPKGWAFLGLGVVAAVVCIFGVPAG